MKRIGILGGSYNPPHLGHLEIAEAAMQALGLDEVWFWVSYNIFKDPNVYAPLDNRTAMAKLLKGDKRLWLKVVDMEKDFCDPMTATSLTMLQTMQPDDKFVWIFGDDNFASFHNWNREKFKVGGAKVPDWQYILNNFSVAVMRRPGYRQHARASTAAQYGKDLFVKDPKQLGLSGKGANGGGWTFVNNRAMKESSTHIKQQLLAGERSIKGLTKDLEDYIYGEGLFLPHTDFNAVAKPAAPHNNDVRFHTFLLLASTANLVKTVGAHNNAFDVPVLLKHAEATWDRVAAKGDFGKIAEARGEIADSLISLYSLASAHGVVLPGDQAGVTQWCQTHYPGQDTKALLQDCVEELTELCVCEGLEKHRVLNLLRRVLDDPHVTDMNAAFGRQYALLQFAAEDTGEDLNDILNDKMTINCKRTPDESVKRLAAKNTALKDLKP